MAHSLQHLSSMKDHFTDLEPSINPTQDLPFLSSEDVEEFFESICYAKPMMLHKRGAMSDLEKSQILETVKVLAEVYCDHIPEKSFEHELRKLEVHLKKSLETIKKLALKYIDENSYVLVRTK